MNTSIKLSKEEIAELVAEKEAELCRQVERLKYEKSLKSLISKMDKKGFYINRSTYSHMEKEEKDRWRVSTYRA